MDIHGVTDIQLFTELATCCFCDPTFIEELVSKSAHANKILICAVQQPCDCGRSQAKEMLLNHAIAARRYAASNPLQKIWAGHGRQKITNFIWLDHFRICYFKLFQASRDLLQSQSRPRRDHIMCWRNKELMVIGGFSNGAPRDWSWNPAHLQQEGNRHQSCTHISWAIFWKRQSDVWKTQRSSPTSRPLPTSKQCFIYMVLGPSKSVSDIFWNLYYRLYVGRRDETNTTVTKALSSTPLRNAVTWQQKSRQREKQKSSLPSKQKQPTKTVVGLKVSP